MEPALEVKAGPEHEVALCFMFVGLSVGSLITYLISRYAHSIPYTVVLFLIGIILIQCVLFFDFRVLGESVQQWSRIDPHLLLFSFLPALLFGEAMSLNIHNIKLTFASAVLMAGPGAIFGTIVVAAMAFSMIPYGWPLSLCLTFGSIMCATDPVAVVAVLKSLGASPRMTMLVTLEALMNDGAALVLYNLFFASMLYENKGQETVASEVVLYFVEVLTVSPLVGIAFGLACCGGFALANERMKHDDITIQISITLCCAYLSFFVAEHVLEVSGVLSCCAAGVVVAWLGPPLILQHESMHSVWGMCEWIGNTLIFLLAGILFGETLKARTGVDFLVLICVYVFLHIIRAAMFVLLFPLISRLGCGVTVRDCAFMTYGGLRGAVGIALALALQQETDDGLVDIDTIESHRLFFIVGGVAALTLLINATSSQQMLSMLGLFEESSTETKTMQHYARKRIHKGITQLIMDLHDELPAYSDELVAKFCNIVTVPDEEEVQPVPVEAVVVPPKGGKKRRASLSGAISGTSTPFTAVNGNEKAVEGNRKNTANFLKKVKGGNLPLSLHSHMHNVHIVTNPVEPEMCAIRRPVHADGTATSPDASKNTASDNNNTCQYDNHGNLIPGASRPLKTVISMKRHGTFNFLNEALEANAAEEKEKGMEMSHKKMDLSNLDMLERKMAAHDHKLGIGAAPLSVRPALATAVSNKPDQVIDDILHTETIEVKTELDEQLMVHVRSAFLNVLRSSYWKLIEEGKIPRASPVALNLLTSVDIAQDDVQNPGLHDWDYLKPKLCCPHVGTGFVANTVDWMSLKFENFLKTIRVLPAESRFRTSWGPHALEWHDSYAINTLAAVIAAHLRAQRLVKYYLGESAELNTPEELLCVEESNYSVDEAKAMLQSYDQNTISYHVSKQVARIIVFTQEDIIHKLLKEGILTEKDADVLLDETRINQKMLKRSWLATMFDREESNTKYHKVSKRPQQA